MGWDGKFFTNWLREYPESFFEKQPLSARLKESFEELDHERGLARLSFEIGADFCNYSGRVHGGTIALMIDEAIGVAAFSYVGDRFKATVESKTSFFRSLWPGAVVVEAKVVHLAPTLCFLEAKVIDQEGAVVAKSMATIALKPLPVESAGPAGQGGPS